MKKMLTAIALSLAVSSSALVSSAMAANCADGLTLKPDVLTIATGNPAYFPWVHDDAPESGKGYEAAVAYEVASRMGFEKDAVRWVRTSFDQAIQPGAKDFDFNLQQYTIRPEREETIDFSKPYYNSSLAVVVRPDVAERLGDEVSAEELRSLKFGGASGQTSSLFVEEQIKPETDMLLYDDMSDAQAALMANQIEAAIFELPTALFITAVQYKDGKVIGTFAPSEDWQTDQFGLVFADGNKLRKCADEALASMEEDGTLKKLVDTWINSAADIPRLSLKD